MGKYHYNCPQGLMDDFKKVKIDEFCRWKCFKSYGGCQSCTERQVLDIPGIINKIKWAIKKEPGAKIFLDAPNFCEHNSGMVLPGQEIDQRDQLLQEIIKSYINGYFWVDTTVYGLVKRDDEYLNLLARAGIKKVWLGVESGNRKLRGEYRKPPFSNKQLKMVMNRLKEQKILCGWYLVAGFLDSDDTISETINLVSKLKPYRIFLHQTLPYEGAKENLVDLERLKGRITDIKGYQNRIQQIQSKLYREFYSR